MCGQAKQFHFLRCQLYALYTIRRTKSNVSEGHAIDRWRSNEDLESPEGE